MNDQRRLMRFLLVLCILGLMVRVALAASFSGTIEDVSTDDKTITVKLAGKKEESKTFTLAPTAVILLDGKKAKFEDVSGGQTVVVLTNSGDTATKLTLKSPKNPPAGKKPKRTTEPGNESASDTGSWPQYQGPNRDNISKETGLLNQWPDGGPKLAWQQKGLGEGYSSVSIAEGKIFTMGTQGNQEMLLAMNSSNGKPIWTRQVSDSVFRNNQGNGPRSTPTVDDDRVYALGANGDLICVGIDQGEVVWQKNILREYDGSNIEWGISESVLIDGNNVICYPGGRNATIVALNKLTGQGVWRCTVDGSPRPSYASPILVDFGKERMIVNFVHTGVVAVRSKGGDFLWGFPQSANGTANCSSPVYSNGMVFTSSGYNTGCAMFKLGTGGKAKVEYDNKEMKNHHGGMVVLEDHVYGFDEGTLKCIDLKSGKTAWKDRSVGKGAVTYADGHLYLRSENGPVALCVATTSGYQEQGRFEPRNRSNNSAWSHPVVCGGRLYLRDMDSLTVYDVKK